MLRLAPEGPHAVTPPFLFIGEELKLGHRKISERSEKQLWGVDSRQIPGRDTLQGAWRFPPAE